MAGTIGSALEASVILGAASSDELRQLTAEREALTILTIVSAVEVVPGHGSRTVQVKRAEGRKCARCWMFRAVVGQHPEHPELCERCVSIVTGVPT